MPPKAKKPRAKKSAKAAEPIVSAEPNATIPDGEIPIVAEQVKEDAPAMIEKESESNGEAEPTQKKKKGASKAKKEKAPKKGTPKKVAGKKSKADAAVAAEQVAAEESPAVAEEPEAIAEADAKKEEPVKVAKKAKPSGKKSKAKVVAETSADKSQANEKEKATSPSTTSIEQSEGEVPSSSTSTANTQFTHQGGFTAQEMVSTHTAAAVLPGSKGRLTVYHTTASAGGDGLLLISPSSSPPPTAEEARPPRHHRPVEVLARVRHVAGNQQPENVFKPEEYHKSAPFFSEDLNSCATAAGRSIATDAFAGMMPSVPSPSLENLYSSLKIKIAMNNMGRLKVNSHGFGEYLQDKLELLVANGSAQAVTSQYITSNAANVNTQEDARGKLYLSEVPSTKGDLPKFSVKTNRRAGAVDWCRPDAAVDARIMFEDWTSTSSSADTKQLLVELGELYKNFLKVVDRELPARDVHACPPGNKYTFRNLRKISSTEYILPSHGTSPVSVEVCRIQSISFHTKSGVAASAPADTEVFVRHRGNDVTLTAALRELIAKPAEEKSIDTLSTLLTTMFLPAIQKLGELDAPTQLTIDDVPRASIVQPPHKGNRAALGLNWHPYVQAHPHPALLTAAEQQKVSPLETRLLSDLRQHLIGGINAVSQDSLRVRSGGRDGIPTPHVVQQNTPVPKPTNILSFGNAASSPSGAMNAIGAFTGSGASLGLGLAIDLPEPIHKLLFGEAAQQQSTSAVESMDGGGQTQTPSITSPAIVVPTKVIEEIMGVKKSLTIASNLITHIDGCNAFVPPAGEHAAAAEEESATLDVYSSEDLSLLVPHSASTLRYYNEHGTQVGHFVPGTLHTLLNYYQQDCIVEKHKEASSEDVSTKADSPEQTTQVVLSPFRRGQVRAFAMPCATKLHLQAPIIPVSDKTLPLGTVTFDVNGKAGAMITNRNTTVEEGLSVTPLRAMLRHWTAAGTKKPTLRGTLKILAKH